MSSSFSVPLATRKPVYSLKSPPRNIPIPKPNLTVPPDILKPALEQPLPEPGLHKDDPMQRILEPPLRDGDGDVAAGTREERLVYVCGEGGHR